MHGKNIKSWAADDRPREKLISKGRANLSDSELLAILIGSGTRDKTAIDLAKMMLAANENNLSKLSRLSIHDLTKTPGIGQAKAVTILAALELGSRRKAEKDNYRIIHTSDDAFAFYYPIVCDLDHEEFHVLFLNRANRIIGSNKISSGGVEGTLVDIKIILKHAIEHLASSMILCHNHPSGRTKPSTSDIALTNKIKSAGNLLSVSLLDHIIISGNTYFSFGDEGLIETE
ncbi:MAG: DNA repair protein RadC [Bacteroidetes bacterium]|nr:DNA repair protein RadC [Bacteroidota bacterium]MBU1717535.1 DNA repair protein RadC [Bacteroidota bacterium]